jgi:hypothetical protein
MTAQNAPFSSLGEFGQLVGAFEQSELPDADPTLALADLRSWNYGAVASVRRQLNARQSLQVGYDYARTDYESDTGYDTRAHSLTSDYSWQLRRNAALTANYRFGQTLFLGDIANSQKTHTIDTGFDYSRRVSATRYIGVSGALGASYTDEEQRVSDPETEPVGARRLPRRSRAQLGAERALQPQRCGVQPNLYTAVLYRLAVCERGRAIWIPCGQRMVGRRQRRRDVDRGRRGRQLR